MQLILNVLQNAFFYCESHLSYILYSHDRQGRFIAFFINNINLKQNSKVFDMNKLQEIKFTFTQTKIEIKKLTDL